MSNALTPVKAGEIMEAVIARGDLAQLTPAERGKYYVHVCETTGLNPATRPFEYLVLNGKTVLYARKDATDQLRSIHKISVMNMSEIISEGVVIVTCKVSNGEGRTDIAKGAVNIAGLKGDALANALMKAETKAKRRATLSICGLGFLDETEIETIPVQARQNPHVTRAEDIVDVPAFDDPDRVPSPSYVDAATNNIQELPRMQQRPIADKLGKELAAFDNLEQLLKWKNLPETAQRLATIRHEWREVFQGRLKEKLNDLRSQRKMTDDAEYMQQRVDNGEWGEEDADFLSVMETALGIANGPEGIKLAQQQLDLTKRPISNECRIHAQEMINVRKVELNASKHVAAK